MDIPITGEVIDNAKVVELESNGFETVKESKPIHVEYIDQHQTVFCQGSE